MLKYATELKPGSHAIIEDVACVIKAIDISKTGKHGHAKVRIEAIGIIDGKKRIIVVPGDERFSIPLIEKRRAQVLSINKQGMRASIMDLESFETMEVPMDSEIAEKIKEKANVEYWTIEGHKIIKRVV